MEKLHNLIGPEFLDLVADAEAANCNDINAHAFRRNATEWAADRKRMRTLEQANRDLTDRLEDILRTAQAG